MSTLDELFALDPEKLTREDRAEIIRVLREQRHQWKLDEASGKHKRAKKDAAKPNISIDLLELKL